jgi:beta-carotene ketolase (CrtW type)
MQMISFPKKTFDIDDWSGLLIVIVVFGIWFTSLVGSLIFLSVDISWFWIILTILGRTYLHTGLFILAHDAMHGNLIPHHKFLNNLIGRFAVVVYGFLPYDHCRTNHHNHHRYPSQSRDPDFHGNIAHPFFWYCKFMREYLPLRSLIIFLVNVCLIFLGLIIIFHVPLINLILFWIFPLVLSSLQLFFFGTYLPHRQVHNNSHFSPRIQSDRFSIFWSFISCYNFGHYHWEHHEYSQIPWYRLHKTQIKK